MFDPDKLIAKRKELTGPDGNELSISKLAVMIGSDRSMVSGWENGRRTPTVESLARVAVALGCTMDDLTIRPVLGPTQ